MVKAEKADLRWGVEQRLEFIEFRLFWEGHVNRGDLMDAFGVSVNQASTDLNRYIGMVPQDDVLLATSSVEEAVQFSAAMRLPREYTVEQRLYLIQ